MLGLRSVLEMAARRHPAYGTPHIVVRPKSTHGFMGTVDSEDRPARGRLRGRRPRPVRPRHRPAPRGVTGDNTSSIFGNTSSAGGAGDTNVPAAFQLAGLGALPGLADLPSLAGLANMPARNGVTGGGIPMPGTAMSAANTSGRSHV